MTISLEASRSIIRETLAQARQLKLRPLAVVVLDSGGRLKAFEREDGTSTHRFEIAFGKAHGAIALGVGSRALAKRAEEQPHFIASATAAVGGSLIPVPGGVLIVDESGATIGAVGVTGDTSDNDESVAIAGIEFVGWFAVTD